MYLRDSPVTPIRLKEWSWNGRERRKDDTEKSKRKVLLFLFCLTPWVKRANNVTMFADRGWLADTAHVHPYTAATCVAACHASRSTPITARQVEQGLSRSVWSVHLVVIKKTDRALNPSAVCDLAISSGQRWHIRIQNNYYKNERQFRH